MNKHLAFILYFLVSLVIVFAQNYEPIIIEGSYTYFGENGYMQCYEFSPPDKVVVYYTRSSRGVVEINEFRYFAQSNRIVFAPFYSFYPESFYSHEGIDQRGSLWQDWQNFRITDETIRIGDRIFRKGENPFR